MSVETPNRDWHALEPEFALRLALAVLQANRESRKPDGTPKFAGFVEWQLFEGFRSQARQDFLYAKGRTTPGPKVTNAKKSNHTKRKAGDVVWRDRDGDWHWDGPDALWAILGHCARSQKLAWGGDWKKFVDKPHIEAKG